MKTQTIKQLSDLYSLSESTIRTYIDGYKFAPYRKSNVEIVWNKDTMSLIDELASRKGKVRRTRGYTNGINDRISYLENKIKELEGVINELRSVVG